MSGGHRKPNEPLLIRPVDAETARSVIAAQVAEAVNQAAAGMRRVREYCDRVEHEVTTRQPEERAETTSWWLAGQLAAVVEIRALLPPVPADSGEVDMEGTRVTFVGDDEDREY